MQIIHVESWEILQYLNRHLDYKRIKFTKVPYREDMCAILDGGDIVWDSLSYWRGLGHSAVSARDFIQSERIGVHCSHRSEWAALVRCIYEQGLGKCMQDVSDFKQDIYLNISGEGYSFPVQEKDYFDTIISAEDFLSDKASKRVVYCRTRDEFDDVLRYLHERDYDRLDVEDWVASSACIDITHHRVLGFNSHEHYSREGYKIIPAREFLGGMRSNTAIQINDGKDWEQVLGHFKKKGVTWRNGDRVERYKDCFGGGSGKFHLCIDPRFGLCIDNNSMNWKVISVSYFLTEMRIGMDNVSPPLLKEEIAAISSPQTNSFVEACQIIYDGFSLLEQRLSISSNPSHPSIWTIIVMIIAFFVLSWHLESQIDKKIAAVKQDGRYMKVE